MAWVAGDKRDCTSQGLTTTRHCPRALQDDALRRKGSRAHTCRDYTWPETSSRTNLRRTMHAGPTCRWSFFRQCCPWKSRMWQGFGLQAGAGTVQPPGSATTTTAAESDQCMSQLAQSVVTVGRPCRISVELPTMLLDGWSRCDIGRSLRADTAVAAPGTCNCRQRTCTAAATRSSAAARTCEQEV